MRSFESCDLTLWKLFLLWKTRPSLSKTSHVSLTQTLFLIHASVVLILQGLYLIFHLSQQCLLLFQGGHCDVKFSLMEASKQMGLTETDLPICKIDVKYDLCSFLHVPKDFHLA